MAGLHSGRIRRSGIQAAIGLCCVASVGACGLLSDVTGEARDGGNSAAPAQNTPWPAATDAAGLVTRLPEIESAVSRALPDDIAEGKLWTDPYNKPSRYATFSWTVVDARHNRLLTLHVTRKASIAEAKKQAAYVRKELANDRSQTGPQVVRTGRIEEAEHIADECLGFRITRKNALSGVIGDSRYQYSMSGRYLYCRFKNVNMEIDWEGQDYSRPWAVKTGTGLNQAAADRDVQQIARAVMALFR